MLELDKKSTMRYGLYEIVGDVAECNMMCEGEADAFRWLKRAQREFKSSQWILVDFEKKVSLSGGAVAFRGETYLEEAEAKKARQPLTRNPLAKRL